MNVSLTPQLEDMINSKVESGQYNSASEVVREGLRLLQERDLTREEKLRWLRGEIEKGIDDLEAGRYRDGREAMQELRARLLEMKRTNG
jgi:antitoxin ParD1/3/4